MLTVACADNAPVGVPEPCIGNCVANVYVDPEDLILTPGDTARLHAEAKTADGTLSIVRWIPWNAAIAVDSTGLVTAQAPGRTGLWAMAVADLETFGVAEIWVVDADTGGQPFLTRFRDAATSQALPRSVGFVGHDSIAVTVSYVLGRSVVTAGEPHVEFQIRRPQSGVLVRSTTVALGTRGRAAFVDLHLFLTELDARGRRLLPPGAYDLFVVLPLADGRILGDATGYRVTF